MLSCWHQGNYYIGFKKSIHKLEALEECGTVVAHKNKRIRKKDPSWA